MDKLKEAGLKAHEGAVTIHALYEILVRVPEDMLDQLTLGECLKHTKAIAMGNATLAEVNAQVLEVHHDQS